MPLTFKEIRVCQADGQKLNRKLQKGDNIPLPPCLEYLKKKSIPLPTEVLEEAHTFSINAKYGIAQKRERKYHQLKSTILDSDTPKIFLFTCTRSTFHQVWPIKICLNLSKEKT